MTNDREHINRKTQLGKNPSSPGNSINVEQASDAGAAAPLLSGINPGRPALPHRGSHRNTEEGRAAQGEPGQKEEDESRNSPAPLSAGLCCYSWEWRTTVPCFYEVRSNKYEKGRNRQGHGLGVALGYGKMTQLQQWSVAPPRWTHKSQMQARDFKPRLGAGNVMSAFVLFVQYFIIKFSNISKTHTFNATPHYPFPISY